MDSGQDDTERREGLQPSSIDTSILRDDLGFQVHITRRAIWHQFRSRKKRSAPKEPSGYHATLILIGNNPGISQAEIASVLFLDAPNLAIILSKLSERGLVARRPDPSDKRRSLLSLTPSGRQSFGAAVETSRAKTQQIGKGLTREEVRTLIALLHKLQQSLGEGTG